MNKILALTDFSEIAENAVTAAFEFAKQYNAELSIYHHLIGDELIAIDLNNASQLETFGSNNMQAQQALIKWKEIAKNYQVAIKLFIGSDKEDFINELQKVISTTKPDIILMGSKGKGQRKDAIWGSTTELVVRNINCPVLVIKRPMQDYRLDHIVFASSFDKKDRTVFSYFLNLIKPPQDATIHLLAINTAAYFSQPTILMREAMRDYVKLALPWQAKSHFYEDTSKEAGIRNFIEAVKPDLLVMSNKFDKPFIHAVRGNLALKMIAVADFPVLTIDWQD